MSDSPPDRPAAGVGPVGPPAPSSYPPPPGTPYPPPVGTPYPPAYGQGFGYGQPGWPPPGRPRNGFGTAALVLGLVGLLSSWLTVGIVPGMLGVVFGALGRARARRGEASNGGLAVAGLVLGVLAVVASVAAIVLWRAYLHHHCSSYDDDAGRRRLRCDR